MFQIKDILNMDDKFHWDPAAYGRWVSFSEGLDKNFYAIYTGIGWLAVRFSPPLDDTDIRKETDLKNTSLL